MTTGVSICSNALLMLGAQTINSFDDANSIDRAKLCANLYPTTRDKVLRSHPWNCAIKRILLAPDASPPVFGWGYQFQLPADCLRVLEVDVGGAQADYLIEGRSILANEASIGLRYVFANNVENTWDSLLVEIVTLAMAARLAYPVTQSAAMEQSRMQELEMAMRRARAVDGQEDPPQTFGDFPLLQARNGGRW